MLAGMNAIHSTVNYATAPQVDRPETVIESRFTQLACAVNELDELIGSTLNKLSPIIVPYPTAMPQGELSKLPPKPVQCDVANRLEKLEDHVTGITARLREAMANAQL